MNLVEYIINYIEKLNFIVNIQMLCEGRRFCIIAIFQNHFIKPMTSLMYVIVQGAEEFD